MDVWMLRCADAWLLSHDFVAIGPFFLLLRNVGHCHSLVKNFLLNFLDYPELGPVISIIIL